MTAPFQPSKPDAHEQHQIARATAARRLAIGGLIVAVVLMLGTVTYGVAVIRGTQKANTSTVNSAADAAEAAKRTARLIQDCVTPKGKCAQRGQKQTAKAIGDIGQAQMIALSCTFTEFRQGMTAEELLAAIEPCVARLVSAHGQPD